MSSPLLTDETWAALDPRAGALSAAARRRAVLAVVGAAAVVAGLALLWASGLVWPRIRAGGISAAEADAPTRTFSQTVTADNAGWHDERIVRVTSAAPGLRVVRVEAPQSIPAHASDRITVHYVVVDCGAVSHRPVPVTLELVRPWGHVSTTIRADAAGGSIAWLACEPG